MIEQELGPFRALNKASSDRDAVGVLIEIPAPLVTRSDGKALGVSESRGVFRQGLSTPENQQTGHLFITFSYPWCKANEAVQRLSLREYPRMIGFRHGTNTLQSV